MTRESAPTAKQIAALHAWVFPNGKLRYGWKQALNDAWMKSGEGVKGYTPELQELRDHFSVWMRSQSATDIDWLFRGDNRP